MENPTNIEEIIKSGLFDSSFISLLYVILAGLSFVWFYIVLREKALYKRIQQKFPGKERILFEIKYSISSMIIFGLTAAFLMWAKGKGWTQLYDTIDERGIPYFIFTVVFLVFAHDTYFYWGHRFMHLKKVYPIVHLVHHKSINPTPWAAFCFHPLEAMIEAAVVPALVFVMPIHEFAVILFFCFMTFMNVLGHLGYELYPKGFTKSKLLGWNNTSTHHNMHHSKFNCNYGLYFNFWDKIMGTNHEDYHETFDKVAAATPEHK
jgi:Delta7-sterol 5-desaturase